MEENTSLCPKCGAKNRLRAAAWDRVPVCGRCRVALPWIVKADDSSLSLEIESVVPVLVDFWAEWCTPCRALAPVLEDLARDQAGKLKVVKINVDENPSSADLFHVKSIPTVIVFREARAVDTLVGALSKDALLEQLRPHLVS